MTTIKSFHACEVCSARVGPDREAPRSMETFVEIAVAFFDQCPDCGPAFREWLASIPAFKLTVQM